MPNFNYSDKPLVVSADGNDSLMIELAGQPGVYRRILISSISGSTTPTGGFTMGRPGQAFGSLFPKPNFYTPDVMP